MGSREILLYLRPSFKRFPSKMPYACCVPACKGNTESGKKVHIFAFPKDEARQKIWLNAIQRDNFVLSKYSKVCEIHFRKEDIKWTSEYYDSVNDRTLVAPLKIPRLWSDAVPSIFPNRPQILSPPSSSKRTVTANARSQRSTRQTTVATQPDINNDHQTLPAAPKKARLISPDDDPPHLPGCPLYRSRFSFDNLRQLVVCNSKLAPPEPWHILTKRDCVNYVILEMKPTPPRMTRIVSINVDLEVSLYLDTAEVVSLCERRYPSRVNDMTRMHEILNDFYALEASEECLSEEEQKDVEAETVEDMIAVHVAEVEKPSPSPHFPASGTDGSIAAMEQTPSADAVEILVGQLHREEENVGYSLQDNSGDTVEVLVEQLHSGIREGRFLVDNPSETVFVLVQQPAENEGSLETFN